MRIVEQDGARRSARFAGRGAEPGRVQVRAQRPDSRPNFVGRFPRPHPREVRGCRQGGTRTRGPQTHVREGGRELEAHRAAQLGRGEDKRRQDQGLSELEASQKIRTYREPTFSVVLEIPLLSSLTN